MIDMTRIEHELARRELVVMTKADAQRLREARQGDKLTQAERSAMECARWAAERWREGHTGSAMDRLSQARLLLAEAGRFDDLEGWLWLLCVYIAASRPDLPGLDELGVPARLWRGWFYEGRPPEPVPAIMEWAQRHAWKGRPLLEELATPLADNTETALELAREALRLHNPYVLPFDVTTIPGYADMTDEEKRAAFQAGMLRHMQEAMIPPHQFELDPDEARAALDAILERERHNRPLIIEHRPDGSLTTRRHPTEEELQMRFDGFIQASSLSFDEVPPGPSGVLVQPFRFGEPEPAEDTIEVHHGEDEGGEFDTCGHDGALEVGKVCPWSMEQWGDDSPCRCCDDCRDECRGDV